MPDALFTDSTRSPSSVDRRRAPITTSALARPAGLSCRVAAAHLVHVHLRDDRIARHRGMVGVVLRAVAGPSPRRCARRTAASASACTRAVRERFGDLEREHAAAAVVVGAVEDRIQPHAAVRAVQAVEDARGCFVHCSAVTSRGGGSSAPRMRTTCVERAHGVVVDGAVRCRYGRGAHRSRRMCPAQRGIAAADDPDDVVGRRFRGASMKPAFPLSGVPDVADRELIQRRREHCRRGGARHGDDGQWRHAARAASNPSTSRARTRYAGGAPKSSVASDDGARVRITPQVVALPERECRRTRRRRPCRARDPARWSNRRSARRTRSARFRRGTRHRTAGRLARGRTRASARRRSRCPSAASSRRPAAAGRVGRACDPRDLLRYVPVSPAGSSPSRLSSAAMYCRRPKPAAPTGIAALH